MSPNGSGDTGMRVAVIGSGAAGTLTTVQLLLRSGEPGLEVLLIERGERFGRGIAYGTNCRKHLLNVPAGKMSAFPDDDDHLLRWLSKGPMPEAGPYTFVPRRTFGDYLEDVLREAESSSPSGLTRVRGEVIGLDPADGDTVLRFADGHEERVSKVVLAIGNMPAKSPPVATDSFYDSPRYVADAWEPCALSDFPFDEPVMLIGTSLTAIDVALSLKERGHRGTVHAVSRRGLVPNPHARCPTEPHRDFLPPDGETFRLAGLFRQLRYEARDAALDGRHWQSVVDVLRLRTQALWATATDTDRRRFLRHVQPYWEAHRHRIAPEVGEEISRLRDAGEFVTYAGRIARYDESPDGVSVGVSLRGGGSMTLHVAKVINCTGPHTDVRRADDCLVQDLLSSGRARPGPLNLGIDTDDRGALLDAGGVASGDLYTLGTHRKGHLWETIAIPEIRSQAAEIAACILSRSRRIRYQKSLAG